MKDASPSFPTESPTSSLESLISGRDHEAALLLQAVGHNNIVVRPAEVSTRTQLGICQGKACMKRDASVLLEVAQLEVVRGGSQVEVAPCKCLGRCKVGPAVSMRVPGQKRVVLTGVCTEMLPAMLQHSEVGASC